MADAITVRRPRREMTHGSHQYRTIAFEAPSIRFSQILPSVHAPASPTKKATPTQSAGSASPQVLMSVSSAPLFRGARQEKGGNKIVFRARASSRNTTDAVLRQYSTEVVPKGFKSKLTMLDGGGGADEPSSDFGSSGPSA